MAGLLADMGGGSSHQAERRPHEKFDMKINTTTKLQTLTNLVSNAIKFSPWGSSLGLAAQPQGDQVLQVKDQGRGIQAESLQTIFERFQQVDASDSRKKGGTGLGLAICRSIVQQHAGRIWAESTVGEGSCFFFNLPVFREDLLNRIITNGGVEANHVS